MCRLQNSCGGLNLHDGWRGNGETQTVLGLKPNFALLFGEALKAASYAFRKSEQAQEG